MEHSFAKGSRKFSGSYDSPNSLHRFRQLFYDALDTYQITEDRRVPLLAMTLYGMALDFYLHKIRSSPSITNIDSAFLQLEQRFDSAHTRAQA